MQEIFDIEVLTNGAFKIKYPVVRSEKIMYQNRTCIQRSPFISH